MSTVVAEGRTYTINQIGVAAFWVEAGTVLLVALALWGTWRTTARPVVVTVDGYTESVRTHRYTLDALLLDLGLTLDAADQISIAPSAAPLAVALEDGLDDVRVTRGMELTIRRTPSYRLLVDGRDQFFASWGETPQQVLEDAGMAVSRHDEVLLNGEPWPWRDALPAPVKTSRPRTYDFGYDWNAVQSQPTQLRIHRAIPISVNDGRVPFEVFTTAQTVGEALRQARITIFLGDEVQPSLGSPVSTGLAIFITRSVPVSLSVDGREINTRSQARTVGDALTEMSIGLSGLDQVTPALDTELFDDLEIAITRVREDVEVTEEIVPYETAFVPDGEILIDNQELINSGAEGITRHRTRVRYEDGVETERTLEDSWVAQAPDQRVIAYGTRIVPNTIVTSDGVEITYWRRIRMQTSSYSAGTAGVSPTESYYGFTYTGDVMRKGIVAVDPSVIPLRSQVYVPNYGYGDALDTGSAIRARRIDLGYDDDNLVLWSGWSDVYLIWPPPPEYQISWVLPNWPPVPTN